VTDGATPAAAGPPTWLNEPTGWRHEGSDLVVKVDPDTDFWRHTHYGFVRDSGHFLGTPVSGDFVAHVEVHAGYRDRYDQAGLMIRQDAENWIKAGIELDGGTCHLSTVVTHHTSDWSITALQALPDRLGLRLTRSGDAVTVEYAVDGGDWATHRLAWFAPDVEVQVGPMAAAPDGSGFEARFRGWSLTPAVDEVPDQPPSCGSPTAV
jgi:regulation of enolase protein 1 (concanavalin A-like superfamily)